MSDKKFNVGDKVRYIGKDHNNIPEYYPAVGTIGTILGKGEGTDWHIRWFEGSTSGEDCWYCNEEDIELVKDEDITNEEIWEMLKPKMEKNGLKTYYRVTPHHHILSYDCADAQKAIAIAYRSGYERAMKGQSFKIGEKKKQSSHWEWIKPYEIVPDGTKVRYMKRAGGDDGNNPYFPKIGQECIKLSAPGFPNSEFWVQFEGSEYKYTCLDSFSDCFQKWVEDDE